MKVRLIYFILFYVFIYAGNAVYGTFLPVYFQDIGFDSIQIGTLLSLGPLVAILAQPLWGALGDRARTKNMILLILLTGSGVVALLYPLSTMFLYLLLMICIFTFFQTSIFAMSDTITLEVLDRQKLQSFGLIRMGGTFGFAAMSLLFGAIAQKHIGSLFYVYALIVLICFLLVLKFPVIEGHQSKGGSKVSIRVLFRNKLLMLYLGFSFILQVTLGYYYAFFPMYFNDLGGNNLLLGWSMVISSLSEVPFLLFANRIFQRVKVHYILLVAAVATVIRWYLFSVIDSPYWALPVQALHGLIFIVLTVTMAYYINQNVPKELKASGQTLNGLLTLGAARIIGSFAGGIATHQFGMRKVFMYNSVIAVVCTVVFGFIVWRMRGRKDAFGNR
ncbi:MFS transporter [Paenibacillus pinihumi]|uniref:MFS transporter n=1 Tax=Paenibacillus pinihumi TaxID=669462 RepID=UPI00042199B4|nr:MFS transporter [Paenibacillus pinihumi]